MFEELDDVRRWRDEFCERFPSEHHSMRVESYRASVMFARRLEGEGRHGLPAGVQSPAYPVHEYEGCPEVWRRKGDAFFIPIPLGDDGTGPGMWYDWTMNDGGEYDVAIVPSTTGLNPITGQKADALRLERYRDRCPVHNVEFEAERFCPRCEFKWPPQNYVARPNVLWWDGFRRPDGTVRQFWFSDEVLRRDVGVAALGAARVPAFGFAFFRAKAARPKQMHRPARYIEPGSDALDEMTIGAVLDDDLIIAWLGDDSEVRSVEGDTVGSPTLPSVYAVSVGREAAVTAPPPIRRVASRVTRAKAIAETVAVGAGASIDQDLEPDPMTLDEWNDEPAAVMTVYFVPEQVAVEILQGPRRDVVGKPEGYLADLPVELGTK